MKVLNVGGGRVPISPQYDGWDVELLDIDVGVKPDVCLDARHMEMLPPSEYDAVYASHVLEHFCESDVAVVLHGFWHVLNADGFADVRVPDVTAVMRAVAERRLGLDDELYRAPVGPIRVADVLWGWQKEIAASGHDYYGHRWGFSRDLLGRALHAAGFEYVLIGGGYYELLALAYKCKPEEAT